MNLFKNKSISVYLPVLFSLLLLIPALAFAEEFGAVEGVVWTLVTSLFGTLAGVGGWLLNMSVENYIFRFGDLYSTGGWGLAVDTTWVSIRDFFNITFIFGMVYIGFKMILGSSDSQTKSWLINLIMAAILVNFSLYITKFVIDISNSLASEVVSTAFIGTEDDNRGEVVVSESFMNSMGIASIFSPGDNMQFGEGDSQWGYIFGAMVIFIIMMFVFGAGALLLTIRFAVLLLYMIFSPFMFIGWVFPQLQKYTTQYWSGFLGRAFFAPIYLLLLYVSLSVIQNAFGVSEKNGSSEEILGFMTNSSGDDKVASLSGANGFPIFMIASIFLIASLVVAQKMGANGGDAVVGAGKKLAGKIRGGVGAVTSGLAGAAGRKTVGGYGNRVAENKKVQEWARRKGRAGIGGRLIAGAAHKARTASFDARNVAGLGKATGTGEGKKGGYAATQKEKEKKAKERADRYSTQEDDQFYEDAGEGVANIKNEYDQILKNIDQTVSDLSDTTDPQERKDLFQDMRGLEEEKTSVENSTHGGFAEDDMKDFNYVRKNNKTLRQNTYAANLERRLSSEPGFGFLLDHQSNEKSAAAIRKNLSKSNTDRLIDALKDIDND